MSVQITWGDAPLYIQNIAKQYLEHSSFNSIIVGIGGPVGSGKTTLAYKVSETVLTIDDYNKDFRYLNSQNYDLPDTADLRLLSEHIKALRSGKCVNVPVWSHKTHRQKKGTRLVYPTPIIVVEGIHALNNILINQIDVKVMILASQIIRWERWQQLELSRKRGWGINKAKEYFHTISEPTFQEYRQEYLERAEVIVKNE